jgi:hypothetical protein
MMPVACFLTAGSGFFLRKLGGLNPFVAAASMVSDFLVLYVLKLHIPPAMAVALTLSVTFGTLLLTMCFLLYRWLLKLQPCSATGRG